MMTMMMNTSGRSAIIALVVLLIVGFSSGVKMNGMIDRAESPMAFMLRQQLGNLKQAVEAPPQSGCCSPSQWETEAYEFNQIGPVFHKIYYDSINKLVRWDRSGYLEKPNVYSELTTFTNYTTEPFRYEWLYYPLTNECELYGADEFNAWCFGAQVANQTFLGTLTLSGQTQNIWNEDQNGFVWTSSEDLCLPTFSALGSFDTWFFFNSTVGISDPSVFTPPSVCNTNSLHSAQQMRTRDNRQRVAGLFL
eukprot:TRINITY_DN691_c0_g1_i1.p1 TRINITY_DN691_c0_g1~~TRINITY_DN691_c0_g1_i1.p1  ORF type:complete len:250 (-),score=71.33 TRINITY_DN691_c0_g1_i1:161-910(-)